MGPCERRLDVVEVREHERERADPLERAAERQTQIFPVVGKTRGDQDDRPGPARTLSTLIHQTSRCFISGLLIAVR
jgi:hypothetical protein